MSFVQKILHEANLEQDMQSELTAQKYIDKILELVSKFPKSKYVSYNPKLKFATVMLGGLKVQIYASDSTYSQNAGMNAGYEPRTNLLNVYNVDIQFDERNKTLKFNIPDKQREEIKHELIHFLDIKRGGKTGIKDVLSKIEQKFTPEYTEWAKKAGIDPKTKQAVTFYYNHTGQDPRIQRDYGEYVNNAHEMNAHFLEFVMPQINKYIQNKGELPKEFNTFKDEIFKSNHEFSNYYQHLTDENKKRFLKRLAVYFQSIKNYVIKDPEVKFDKASTQLDIHNAPLDKIFKAVKNIFTKKAA